MGNGWRQGWWWNGIGTEMVVEQNRDRYGWWNGAGTERKQGNRIGKWNEERDSVQVMHKPVNTNQQLARLHLVEAERERVASGQVL